MSKRPFIVFGLFAAICVLVIPFIALGKEGDEDAGTVQVESRDRDAQDMFATNCGTCHTLAAAGTDGVVGPNLDELLGGLPDQESRVEAAIVNGIEGRMPAGILTGPDVTLVSNFVAEEAGR